MEADEIDLLELVSIVRRRLWILLTVPVVAALTAAAVSLYVLDPIYEASTTLWVVKKESGAIDYQTLLLYRNLTKTYGEVAKSRRVLEKAAASLGGTPTADQLQNAIRVTPVRDTEILQIAVQDTDPHRAADAANAIAQAFTEEIQRFIRLDNVGTVDPAEVPRSPVKPKPVLNTALALVLGVMVALGLIFLVELADTSLRTPEDVERRLGLPVLGVIPIIEPVGAQPAPVADSSGTAAARSGVYRSRPSRQGGAATAITGTGGRSREPRVRSQARDRACPTIVGGRSVPDPPHQPPVPGCRPASLESCDHQCRSRGGQDPHSSQPCDRFRPGRAARGAGGRRPPPPHGPPHLRPFARAAGRPHVGPGRHR